MNMLTKIIHGEMPTDDEIAAELTEICENVHASCDDECPVYARLHSALNPHRPFEENRGCDAFKSGSVMLNFIRDFDAGTYKPAHSFVDAQVMAEKHPATFDAPSFKALGRVKVGDSVKICANDKERFWVTVIAIDRNNVTGKIDNDLGCTDMHGLKYGDTVKFELRHIYQL